MLNMGVGQTVAEQSTLVPLEKAKDAIDKTLESSALIQLSSDPCLQMQLKDDGGNHGVIRARVENRVVILEGTIETKSQKAKAEELMRALEKVRDVLNELEVIGPKDATEVCDFIGFGEEEEAEEEEEAAEPSPTFPPIPMPGGRQ